jgi:hypothetical protein
MKRLAVWAGGASDDGVPKIPRAATPGYLRKTLYRDRYLVFGVVLAAVAGQIAFGCSTASSRIDLSSGGVADWPQYGRGQEGTWPGINEGTWPGINDDQERPTGRLNDGASTLNAPQLTEQPEEDDARSTT